MKKRLCLLLTFIFIFTASINVSAAEVTPEQAQAVTMNWVVATYYGGDCIKASQDVNFPVLYTNAYPIIENVLNNTIQVPITQPTQQVSSIQSTTDSTEVTVYVASSGNGECYHFNSSCSNMKSPRALPISKARAAGYRACSKCHAPRANFHSLNTL